jgi:hypothetical protein
MTKDTPKESCGPAESLSFFSKKDAPKGKNFLKSRLISEKCFVCPAKIKSAGVPVSIKMVV